MSRGPDAATQLERAIECGAAGAGVTIRVIAADWQRWASATFAGARHHLQFHAAPSDALDEWLAALPDTEFMLRGHLVADLVVLARRDADGVTEVEIEALTVEEQ